MKVVLSVLFLTLKILLIGGLIGAGVCTFGYLSDRWIQHLVREEVMRVMAEPRIRSVPLAIGVGGGEEGDVLQSDSSGNYFWVTCKSPEPCRVKLAKDSK